MDNANRDCNGCRIFLNDFLEMLAEVVSPVQLAAISERAEAISTGSCAVNGACSSPPRRALWRN